MLSTPETPRTSGGSCALTPLKPGLAFHFDELTLLRGLNFTLTTEAGDLDLLGEIAGGGDFGMLGASCVELEVFGTRCLCLGLRKLID